MRPIALLYQYHLVPWRAASALLACAAAALLIANVAFVGLTINAAAGQARARTRADALSARAAELETQFARQGMITPAEAGARGFGTPAMLSYTAKRPLGRAATGNEL